MALFFTIRIIFTPWWGATGREQGGNSWDGSNVLFLHLGGSDMVHSICQNPVSRTINIAAQKVLYFIGKVLEGV